jgi:hypothetical protein
LNAEQRTLEDYIATEWGYGIDDNQAECAFRIARERLLDDPDVEAEDAFEEAKTHARTLVPTAHEAALEISALRNGPTFCYLAFFGLEGRAQFVKVGRSTHPERRIYSFTTGNPLDLLAIYARKFISRQEAHAAEQSILKAAKETSRRGEWLVIEDGAEPAIVAERIGSAINCHNGGRDVFEPIMLERAA